MYKLIFFKISLFASRYFRQSNIYFHTAVTLNLENALNYKFLQGAVYCNLGFTNSNTKIYRLFRMMAMCTNV